MLGALEQKIVMLDYGVMPYLSAARVDWLDNPSIRLQSVQQVFQFYPAAGTFRARAE
ncbi:hypothetical protein KCP69_22680 [Salmonella enterica subsp. enterica]|nr:hypothetical protein KCP69_22680 [Salmonella enterica subsp. enterica]